MNYRARVILLFNFVRNKSWNVKPEYINNSLDVN